MEDKKALGMTFEETARTFDYGRAVVMFQNRLPVDFWENMTIHQQVLVYEASAGSANKELAETMFNKLANTSIDFASWQEIYGWAPPNSDLQVLARAKMVELAGATGEWEAVYNLGPSDGGHKKIALENIARLNAQHY